MSSRGQQDRETPEDQRRALDRLRKSRPGILVERIEQQVSGAASGEDRPDLQRLALLAQSKAFDEVRVRHLDRLTRHEDPVERAAVLSMVRRAGALIVDASGAELDPATMPGELMWVFSTLGAAEERRKIAERTMGGKRRLAAEGRLVNSTPPWGRAFDKVSGAWSLTPAAKDYERLFTLALDGLTLSKIARAMEDRGIASPRGRPWTTTMVYNLIRNPHASGRYRSHGSESRIPAIVDEATQVLALARLAANDSTGGAHAQIPALLRKVLVCAVCGSAMHTNRNSHRPGGKPCPPFYYCSSRGPCRVNHRIADVDEAVQRRLKEWLSRPATLAIMDGGAQPGGDEENDAQARAQARKKLADEEERLGRLTLRGALSEEAGAKLLAEIQKRRSALDREDEEAKQRARFLARRAEAQATMAAKVAHLQSRLGKASFAEWRAVVEILFPPGTDYRVRIWPDGRIVIRAALDVGDASSHSRMRVSIPVTI